MQAIKRILCVTNLSLTSKNAEIAALRLAEHLKTEITVLSCGESYAHAPNNFFDENIIQPQPHFPHTSEYIKFLEQKKLETINHFENLTKNCNIKMPENIVYEIKTDNEVTAAIDTITEKNNSYDLIIVAKQHNSFWERLLFGSPAVEICDESHISTLLIPSEEEWSNWWPKEIIVASSLTEKSSLAEEYAATIAKKLKLNLSILHIIDTFNLNFNINIPQIFPIDYIPSQLQTNAINEIKKKRIAEINEVQSNLINKYNLESVNIHLNFGRVGDEILNYIKKCGQENLLVMGASEGSALKRFFLGSKMAAIEEACSIPLLITHKNRMKNIKNGS